MRPWSVLPLVALAAACASSSPSLSTNAATRPTVVTSDGTFDSQLRTAAADVDRASVTVAAPPERVWPLLPGVYQKLGIPVGANDPATRMLGNRQVTVTSGKLGGQPMSTYLNCGSAEYGGFAANAYRVNMSIASLVRPAATGQSEVQTLIEASATNVRSSQSRAARPCTSTGALERRIAAEVRTQLAS